MANGAGHGRVRPVFPQNGVPDPAITERMARCAGFDNAPRNTRVERDTGLKTRGSSAPKV